MRLSIQLYSIAISDREKTVRTLVWWGAFGSTLFFRPVAEVVIWLTSLQTCALPIGTLDGGSPLPSRWPCSVVPKAVKYNGYESLSGIVVIIWRTTLATVPLIALLGGLKLQRAMPRHITLPPPARRIGDCRLPQFVWSHGGTMYAS